MHEFYEDLKYYILNQEDELKKTLIPYYETLYQLENYTEMKELLDTYAESKYRLIYNEPDEHDYNSNGWIEAYNLDSSTSYTIELSIGSMQGNYCQCEPSSNGYVSSKNCCGIDCDVQLPFVSITKEVKVIIHEFQGYECDLWSLEDKWNTEYDKELLHKQQLDNIKYIEDQIAEYQKALEVAKSQLQEN